MACAPGGEGMNRFVGLLAIVLCSGCLVSKKKYDAALADGVQKDERIQVLTGEKATQAQQIAALEADIVRLNGEIAALNQEITRLQGELTGAQSALATKIKESGALQADIEKMRQALRELEERKAQTEASLRAYRDLVARFQSMIDSGTLKVKVVDGRMIVELATDILFPSGSATLSADGASTIKAVAQVLASIPGRDFQIAGHTDNVPIASERFPSNWELGAARSITVTRLLVESGLPADRVSASSYADTQPVDSNETKEGKARNRRIEIVVVPDLSEMPGYDELQAIAGGK